MINGKPAIGISIVCSDWHWYTMLSNPSGYMNGSADNGQWIVDDEKQKVYYKHAADGQKEYYKWLNEMYNEGILDPEFATQTHEDFVLKVAEGRVLGLLDEEWVIQALRYPCGQMDRRSTPMRGFRSQLIDP